MRILMVSDVYFPRINGVSTSIQTFRRELRRLGHESDLIAPAYPQGGAPEEGLLRIASRRVPRDPEDRMMKRSEIRRALPGLRAARFDLVHVQTPFLAHYAGLQLAHALDVPVVETYHTYFEEYLHHYVPLLPRALTRFAARRFTCAQGNAVDHLIAPSQAMRDALVAYGVRTPVSIVPTGLEADRFVAGDGARLRRKLGIALDRPVVVHVGRIAHEKNVDFLLHMFARLHAQVPEALFLIAGEGPALPHCGRLAGELGVSEHVLFVGYLDRRTDLLDCYRAGDVFVFASRTETQGLVLLEAMAQGVPVVSTAHMGTIDILAAGRGCLISPEHEVQFAGEVAKVLDRPGLRIALGREAREHAVTWSSLEMAGRLAQLYQTTIAGARAGLPQSSAA